MRAHFSLWGPLVLLVAACATTGDDGGRLVTFDHHVRVKSTAPARAPNSAPASGGLIIAAPAMTPKTAPITAPKRRARR